jgi:hypothetical protein
MASGFSRVAILDDMIERIIDESLCRRERQDHEAEL